MVQKIGLNQPFEYSKFQKAMPVQAFVLFAAALGWLTPTDARHLVLDVGANATHPFTRHKSRSYYHPRSFTGVNGSRSGTQHFHRHGGAPGGRHGGYHGGHYDKVHRGVQHVGHRGGHRHRISHSGLSWTTVGQNEFTSSYSICGTLEVRFVALIGVHITLSGKLTVAQPLEKSAGYEVYTLDARGTIGISFGLKGVAVGAFSVTRGWSLTARVTNDYPGMATKLGHMIKSYLIASGALPESWAEIDTEKPKLPPQVVAIRGDPGTEIEGLTYTPETDKIKYLRVFTHMHLNFIALFDKMLRSYATLMSDTMEHLDHVQNLWMQTFLGWQEFGERKQKDFHEKVEASHSSEVHKSWHQSMLHWFKTTGEDIEDDIKKLLEAFDDPTVKELCKTYHSGCNEMEDDFCYEADKETASKARNLICNLFGSGFFLHDDDFTDNDIDEIERTIDRSQLVMFPELYPKGSQAFVSDKEKYYNENHEDRLAQAQALIDIHFADSSEPFVDYDDWKERHLKPTLEEWMKKKKLWDKNEKKDLEAWNKIFKGSSPFYNLIEVLVMTEAELHADRNADLNSFKSKALMRSTGTSSEDGLCGTSDGCGCGIVSVTTYTEAQGSLGNTANQCGSASWTVFVTFGQKSIRSTRVKDEETGTCKLSDASSTTKYLTMGMYAFQVSFSRTVTDAEDADVSYSLSVGFPDPSFNANPASSLEQIWEHQLLFVLGRAVVTSFQTCFQLFGNEDGVGTISDKTEGEKADGQFVRVMKKLKSCVVSFARDVGNAIKRQFTATNALSMALAVRKVLLSMGKSGGSLALTALSSLGFPTVSVSNTIGFSATWAMPKSDAQKENWLAVSLPTSIPQVSSTQIYASFSSFASASAMVPVGFSGVDVTFSMSVSTSSSALLYDSTEDKFTRPKIKVAGADAPDDLFATTGYLSPGENNLLPSMTSRACVGEAEDTALKTWEDFAIGEETNAITCSAGEGACGAAAKIRVRVKNQKVFRIFAQSSDAGFSAGATLTLHFPETTCTILLTDNNVLPKPLMGNPEEAIEAKPYLKTAVDTDGWDLKMSEDSLPSGWVAPSDSTVNIEESSVPSLEEDFDDPPPDPLT